MYFRIILLLSILFSCIFTGIPQNAGTDPEVSASYRLAQKYYDQATSLSTSGAGSEQSETVFNRKALETFQRTLLLIDQKKDKQDSLHYWTQFRIGELHHYFEEFNEAFHAYSAAISIVRKAALPDSLLFRPLLYNGILCYHANQYDSADHFFQEAEMVLNRNNNSLTESERLFNTKGVMHYEKGDYFQAKNYFEKALITLPESHPYFKELALTYRINIAQLHYKLQDYTAAETIYQELLRSNGPANEIYHNLGLIHLELGIGDKALFYFRKVNYQSNKRIWLYANMSEAFHLKGQTDSAMFYLQEALHIHKEYGSDSDPVAMGKVMKLWGDINRVSDPEAALQQYQKALHQFYPAFSDTGRYSNPRKFSGAFSYIHLFQTLVAKAEVFEILYNRSNNIQWAEEELKTYETAFRLVDYVEKTYESDEARLFLDRSKYIIHSRPIDVSYELYRKTGNLHYLDRLYRLDQLNKAAILALKKHAQDNLGQDSSAKKASMIRREISRLSLKATLLSDSQQISNYNSRIRDLEINLEKAVKNSGLSIRAIEVPSISFIQNTLLEENSILVSFHLSPDKLTRVVISKDSTTCIQKPLAKDFFQQLEKRIEAQRTHGQQLDKTIFDLLFSGMNWKQIERMIIIPDDELNYLSFETLQHPDGKYLIEHTAIQYQYTTAILQKEGVNFKRHQTLAMAPFPATTYRDSTMRLEPLPNSLDEINSIEGMKFRDMDASKKNFLTHIEDFPVIHLATHAIVNHEKDHLSLISFYPVKEKEDFLLFAEEIYHLPLQHTKLVILSACETGSGKLVKGEGIMSLSRAFTYAGCPNIITSLWVANDFSTSYISGKLHGYLNGNHPVDIALQKAKKDYLNDPAIHPRLKHPSYWAHLVFIGNYGVRKASHSSLWWILLSVTGLCTLLVVVIKFRRGRNRHFKGEAEF